MIVTDLNKLAKLDTKIVALTPVEKNDDSIIYEGSLEAGGESLRTKVVVEYGCDEKESIRRVSARVYIADAIVSKNARVKAIAVASRRALDDPAWRFLCVDPSDGETSYNITLVCDHSCEALDRFFSFAKDFIETNADELNELLSDEPGYGELLKFLLGNGDGASDLGDQADADGVFDLDDLF